MAANGLLPSLAEEVICGENSQGDQEGQQHLQVQVFMLVGRGNKMGRLLNETIEAFPILLPVLQVVRVRLAAS
jgi:hypothetical protein